MARKFVLLAFGRLGDQDGGLGTTSSIFNSVRRYGILKFSIDKIFRYLKLHIV